MLKDLLFALQLGIKVMGMFMFCLFLGVNLDAYFKIRPWCTLLLILLAFCYSIGLLLGVYKDG